MQESKTWWLPGFLQVLDILSIQTTPFDAIVGSCYEYFIQRLSLYTKVVLYV